MLGIVAGLSVYAGVVTLLRDEPPVMAGGFRAEEVDGHFAMLYGATSREELVRTLEDRKRELDARHNEVVQRLVDAGQFEFVSADPETHKLSMARVPAAQASAVRVDAVKGASGLYQKVVIPRGFDPDFDLLVEECGWLERKIGDEPTSSTRL